MAFKSTRVMADMLKQMSQWKGFDRVLSKVQVISGEKGQVVCEMKVSEEHSDQSGALHSGLVTTLVDISSTAALMTTGNGLPGVSVDMSISYLEQAKIGDEIVIDAKALRTGRNLAFLAVEIINKSNGLIVAKGQHTKFVGVNKSVKQTDT